MKEIKAFIRPEKLINVTKNLKKEKFFRFTFFEGEGVGNYADPRKEFPSLDFPFLHNKVVKLEIICDKIDEQKIINIIKENAYTGKSGDGLIYVVNVESKFKIKESKI